MENFSVSMICGKYLCAYFMPFNVYGFILSWCRSVALIASVVGDATDAAGLRPTGALLLLIQLGRRRLRAPPARRYCRVPRPGHPARPGPARLTPPRSLSVELSDTLRPLIVGRVSLSAVVERRPISYCLSAFLNVLPGSLCRSVSVFSLDAACSSPA